MDEHDMSWVRTEMALAEAAPRSEAGLGAWVRKNLFASPVDAVLTILAHCSSSPGRCRRFSAGRSSTRSGPAPTAPPA